MFLYSAIFICWSVYKYMNDAFLRCSKNQGKNMWSSMVTHTRNLCSAFNPSKCNNKHSHTPWTHNRSSGQSFYAATPGEHFGAHALHKGLTSVVVLRVERALDIHSPTYNPCRTWDSNSQPSSYKSDSLSIRPRLLKVVGGINTHSDNPTE